MTTVTVTETETQPELPQSEGLEAVADSAVEIAQIQADRDITIAAINAETTQAALEVQAETIEDATWLRNSISELAGEVATLKAQVSTLTTLQETLAISEIMETTGEEAQTTEAILEAEVESVEESQGTQMPPSLNENPEVSQVQRHIRMV